MAWHARQPRPIGPETAMTHVYPTRYVLFLEIKKKYNSGKLLLYNKNDAPYCKLTLLLFWWMAFVKRKGEEIRHREYHPVLKLSPPLSA